jgi:hypothetical protein
VNGDHLLDLATANGMSNSVSVLLGTGTGALGTKTDYTAGINPDTVVLADLNGDLKLDLVNTNSGSDTVSRRLGNGTGGFGAELSFPTNDSPLGISAADLNGDQELDVAVTNAFASGPVATNSLSVLLGDGTGSFEPKVDFVTTNGLVARVVAATFDGDDLPDVAVADWNDDQVSVFLNTSRAPGPPGPPTIIRNAIPGDHEATASWTAPAWDGTSPITGYIVTPYVGYWALPPVTYDSTATTQTITGLTNGTTYRFKVAAINALGAGPTSKVTKPVTVGTPTAPAIGTATAGNGLATVSWAPPASDNDSPIIVYVVTAYDGYNPMVSVLAGPSDTSHTVGGLSNGTTYRFRVRPYNAYGAGLFSTVSNAVTPAA